MLGVGGGNVARNGSKEQPIPAGGGPHKCPTRCWPVPKTSAEQFTGGLAMPRTSVSHSCLGRLQTPLLRL